MAAKAKSPDSARERRPTRRQLQAELDRRRLELEILQCRAAESAIRNAGFYVPETDFRGLHASAGRTTGTIVREAWGDLLDPLEYRYDEPGFRGRLSDKTDFTEQELAEIRAAARLLVQEDGTAWGILDKLTNYCIRQGFTYTVEAEPDANVPAGLVEAVQRLIDDFRDANDWDNDLDREFFRTAHEDGEAFLSLHPDTWGQTQLRTIDADQVKEPDRLPEYRHSWSYGIDTDADDHQTLYGYWVEFPDGLDWLPSVQVEHLKLNTRRAVKRGLTDFYPVSSTLRDTSKLLRNTLRGATIQAAIAFIREHQQGTTREGIESLRAAQSTAQQVATYQTGQRTEFFQRFQPGKILDVVGTKYHPGPLGSSNAPNYINVFSAGLRAAASRWSMPEYLVSSDASNANFASTLVAGDPFVLYCEQQQAMFARRFLRVFWRALEFAVRAGRLHRYGLAYQEIEAILDIKATPPDVAIRNKVEETNRRNTLYQNRVISLKRWREEEGYEPDEMEEQVAQEPPPQGAAGGPGLPQGPQGVLGLESYPDRLRVARALLWDDYPGPGTVRETVQP